MGGKAVFIGLGGAGVYTTAYLKEKLLLGTYGGNVGKLNKDCQFIFVDTDREAITKVNNLTANLFHGGDQLVNTSEIVDLGTVNPYQVYMQRKIVPVNTLTDEEFHMLSWLDESGATNFNAQPLQHGASANRQQGRVALWDRYGLLKEALSRALGILQDIKNQDEFVEAHPVFHILSGTCGGTGSSLFLDVAFILNQEFKLKFNQFEHPIIRAVLFMPQLYIDIYRNRGAHPTTLEDYYCNAYAFFDELDALLKNAYTEKDPDRKKSFHRLCARPVPEYASFEALSKEWPIFNFAFCVDQTTEGDHTLSQDELYRNTAEFLYHWHSGSASKTLISTIDNTQFATYKGTKPGDPVPAFFTMGYRALEFPKKYLEEYLQTRFLYELFEFGLKGKGRDAVPDDNVKRNELKRVFQVCIGRYLFKENLEEGIPNLELVQSSQLTKSMTLSLARFYKEGKDKFDDNKIGDPFLLDALIKDKDAIIETINRDMDYNFSSSDSTVCLSKLEEYIQEGIAGEGSLEDEMESSILRYGLDYTIKFVENLSVACQEKKDSPPTNPIVDLADEKDKRRRKIQELSALVDDARQSCLSERRSGKKIDSLNRLYNSLQEGISLASEIRIIDQQIHILNRLTQEGSGILEQYLQQLQKLSDEVEKTLRRTKDKEGTPSGLDTQYNFDLKGRFHKTRDNVTTTYLPDIADFTLGGDWKTDHVFAQLYTEIVPQLRLPGGRIEPVRYGTDYGLNPDKKGLHKVLWQMLTSPEYHAHEKAYEESGKVLFFRRFFGRKREFDALTMISLLREASLKFVQVEMGRSRRIQTEINRPLQDRINDENRPILLKQFDNNGTETFCKLLTVRASHTMVHTVYAGASEVLVEELDPGRDRPQFINEGDPSRFIKMKVSPLHTLESYPHYRVYKAQYEAAKERRKKEGSVFAPHIHKLFNELGAEKGIRRIDDISIEGQMDRTALLLLYREVCEKAYKENQPLLAEFIHLDSRLTGDAETLYCPLIIENHNGTNMAAVCSKIEMFGDKILLRRGNFVSMGAINNYKDIYDRLVARHDYLSLLDSVDEFDRLFRAKINITWHSISEEAYKALMEKVKDYIDKLKRTSAPNEFRVFFQDMNNRLVRLFQELVNAINTAPGTFELMAGSGAPTDIKQDRL